MSAKTAAHDLINDNPHLKKPVLSVLSLFEGTEAIRRDEVEKRLQDMWDESFDRSPAVVLGILVRTNALAEHVYVNGEPYEGSLEDAQTDESLADDAEAWTSLEMTESGQYLIDTYSPADTLAALYEEHPQYSDVFEAILWACSSDDGCTRADIEAQINELPQLQRDSKTGRKTVYPQYFIDALESAGGIAWDGAWRITNDGRRLI